MRLGEPDFAETEGTHPLLRRHPLSTQNGNSRRSGLTHAFRAATENNKGLDQ